MGRKEPFDKFYTKGVIVDECLSHIDLSKYNTIIEPSAGNGSFSSKIDGCIAYDIMPQHQSIIKQNFLDLNVTYNDPILVIGNPPFGRQNNLSLQFFTKCSMMNVDTIAFILPKSYKKISVHDKIPLNYHLTISVDLPFNSFLLNGDEYDVPCVFQIWDKKNEWRTKSIKLSPTTFRFVKKDENPDFSFRRVGVNAGRVDEDTDKSIQSHYFIKGDINRFKNIKWDDDNTVGPKSISKQEIIKRIEV